MPNHAEVIFETGAKSVVNYDTEDELRAFLQEHHRRATEGEPGSAQDYEVRSDLVKDDPDVVRRAAANANRPAERISKVLLYGKHPGEYAEHGVLFTSAVEQLVAGLADNSGDKPTINVWELIAALRREITATRSGELAPHDSLYKMPHADEMDLSFLDNSNGGES